jgi:hypothetical protein
MRSVVIIEDSEWQTLRRLLAAARGFAASAKLGELKGAVDYESEPGKKLVLLLKEIHEATDALPCDLGGSI